VALCKEGRPFWLAGVLSPLPFWAVAREAGRAYAGAMKKQARRFILKQTRITTAACVLALSLCSFTPARAVEGGGVIVDAILVRPVCLAATAIGSALFVISLPVAAVSKSVKPAAHALVLRPARATFTRPLGDFEDLGYED